MKPILSGKNRNAPETSKNCVFVSPGLRSLRSLRPGEWPFLTLKSYHKHARSSMCMQYNADVVFKASVQGVVFSRFVSD
jgi:hypothetical protein